MKHVAPTAGTECLSLSNCKKQSMASNPYLITRRIVENGRLWGVKLKYQNTFYKMTRERLAEIITHNIKDVIVDMKKGDSPVTLTMYNNTTFRTIHNGYMCDNFNRVKAIKLVSANKLKVRR